jgi:hypothetical protein
MNTQENDEQNQKKEKIKQLNCVKDCIKNKCYNAAQAMLGMYIDNLKLEEK